VSVDTAADGVADASAGVGDAVAEGVAGSVDIGSCVAVAFGAEGSGITSAPTDSVGVTLIVCVGSGSVGDGDAVDSSCARPAFGVHVNPPSSTSRGDNRATATIQAKMNDRTRMSVQVPRSA